MPDSIRDHDQLLIVGYVGGEPSALRVVDGWIEVVLRREFHALAPDWDDVRQEVRTRVFRNLSRGVFRGESDLRTYVHQIAKNVCIDQLRSRRRETGRLAEMPAPDSVPDRTTRQRQPAREFLEALLHGLSARERKLLYLVHVERLSYTEVARVLGTSKGAAKLRMFRCRRKILRRRRRFLRPRSDEEGAP